MNKKELLEEIEKHGYRLNSHYSLITYLIENNNKLEERIKRLNEKVSKIWLGIM